MYYNNIRKVRIERGVTLRELSIATGIETQNIVRLEQAIAPRATTLCRIADALGVTVDRLCGREVAV